jgi:hypothetical protein
MTTRTSDRRVFLRETATAGAALCGLCMCSGIPAFAGEDGDADKVIDPKKLNYCGYTCPKDCKFLEATLNDDVELKKEAYKIWKIEERFGVEFDPEQAICYGCKTLDKPAGIVLQRCDVRTCVREKELECCIECDELTGCDRDLWRRFPTFKKQVVELQKKYRAQA